MSTYGGEWRMWWLSERDGKPFLSTRWKNNMKMTPIVGSLALACDAVRASYDSPTRQT